MSVIVTGMNLPKSCGVCHFNNSSCWCSITKSEIDREFEYHERLDDCPIKSIDVLINKINKMDYLNIEDGSDGYDKYIDQYEVIKIIKEYCEVKE